MGYGVSRTDIVPVYYNADQIESAYEDYTNAFWNGVRDGEIQAILEKGVAVAAHAMASPAVAAIASVTATIVTVYAAADTIEAVIQGSKWLEMLQQMEAYNLRGAMKANFAVTYVEGTNVVTRLRLLDFEYGSNY